jgi:hypothetical protein
MLVAILTRYKQERYLLSRDAHLVGIPTQEVSRNFLLILFIMRVDWIAMGILEGVCNSGYHGYREALYKDIFKRFFTLW